MSKFILSAFADEISPDLQEQVRVLKALRINYLDLRSVGGVNVLNLTNQDIEDIHAVLQENHLQVACIGSPIGKSPINAPLDQALKDLKRIIEIGQTLNTRLIRMFSFYPPENTPPTKFDTYVNLSLARLQALKDLAQQNDAILLLENEKAIVGDTLSRCRRLVQPLTGRHFRFLWDPANFVQVGEKNVTERGWPSLGQHIGYVHIKDALLENGQVAAAGQGDGQVPHLLKKLNEAGYEGFLALEPHLEQAGPNGGFSGPDKMAYAVNTLRTLMQTLHLKESRMDNGRV